MRYKGILLDIDNTLYDYNITHTIAKNNVLKYCVEEFSLSKTEINIAYEKARKKVHVELAETAASHNRLLYFQKMLEILKLNSLKYSFEIYNIYWDSFLEALIPFDGIYDLLEKYENKICLVTDLTAHIQFRKIKKIEIEKYCNNIVTSEEVGREKPHPYMFMLALQKLDLRPNEVCMIGDNFKKDIIGATSLGIESIWYNHEDKIENYDSVLIKEVRNFKDIIELL
ncbi:HAD family hydrolase [Flavobacterium gawalongense]|uniref:HAD family hydrolase n=1 Tax=Flavobacterium gawalongense TaxID=2594432 RepID=A0A553BYK0_9FLAO|nr:HAD family hydrolase [Flavobacterium gawalongense]TRX13400.1 HAD family hydrolase [Flavobacterium gawalongense]TRX15670.1 HAD family hydrolase [Flavobacterium gawalongense]TRX31508.1 HAD family hydrolase [Flavobacterium gawalongense]